MSRVVCPTTAESLGPSCCLPRPLISTPFSSVPRELLRSSIQKRPFSSQIRPCSLETLWSGERSRTIGDLSSARPKTTSVSEVSQTFLVSSNKQVIRIVDQAIVKAARGGRKNG